MRLRGSDRKPCLFVGSSLKDLSAFPADVRADIGYTLDLAQRGDESTNAKALKGFGGRGVMEVVENYDGDTFRAVYTVRLAGYVYVLHSFQKKSKKGVSTPQHDLALVRSRLQAAEADHLGRSARGGLA